VELPGVEPGTSFPKLGNCSWKKLVPPCASAPVASKKYKVYIVELHPFKGWWNDEGTCAHVSKPEGGVL